MKTLTQMAFAVSGFINFDPVVKVNQNTEKEYMNIVLGQGKNEDGTFKPSLNIVAYGQTARLIAAECKKGDLIVVTKMGMINKKAKVQKQDNTTFDLNYVMPVILEYQKIDYKNKKENNENVGYENSSVENKGSVGYESYPEFSDVGYEESSVENNPKFEDFDDDIPF